MAPKGRNNPNNVNKIIFTVGFISLLFGEKLEEKYGIKYLYADFKKKNGYKDSIDLSKKYKLYRQDYCGCIFSFREMEEKKKSK